MENEVKCNHDREGHIIHNVICKGEKKETPEDKQSLVVVKHIEIETPSAPLKSAGT